VVLTPIRNPVKMAVAKQVESMRMELVMILAGNTRKLRRHQIVVGDWEGSGEG
jgi:hypothetical protein